MTDIPARIELWRARRLAQAAGRDDLTPEQAIRLASEMSQLAARLIDRAQDKLVDGLWIEQQAHEALERSEALTRWAKTRLTGKDNQRR